MSSRVLVVAGSFGHAKYLERILVGAAYDVAVATSRDDALALARGDGSDVVLLDARDSGLDPFDLCRAAKKAGRALVLMVTDRHQPSQRLRALDAGADECLSEPVPQSALLARVHSLAELKRLSDELRRLAALTDMPADPVMPGSRALVLVLDPDLRSRERLVELLAGEFELDSVIDPEKGLRNAVQGRYGVAVVSRQWPGSDGLTFGRLLHLATPSQPVRIVFLSDEDPVDRGRWDDIADDLILRPVDRNEAIARVRVAVRKHRLANAIRQCRGNPQPLIVGSVSRRAGRQPPDRFAA
jgi:two-component system cell cycle response regulator